MALLSFLDRERSVAHPGYSRWLVPPAALAIHLCIGQVYAFSVFKIPLSEALGITKSIPGDWTQAQLAWIFSLAIMMLGLSAATFGKWLEGAGPQKGNVCLRGLLRVGIFYFLLWSNIPPAMADLLRIWSHGRHRTRSRIYLARLDTY